ncbi:hypothetical protein [Mesorhizobium sp. SP-1A]|uniref:hypothetical protein n=1 Tax=Mesorhizobium sp. SP-1A TaxID=3077840 RepID=UPI0028F6F605|nr:hypothetical protein [Mesorhizobium sp. SP-1A]
MGIKGPDIIELVFFLSFIWSYFTFPIYAVIVLCLLTAFFFDADTKRRKKVYTTILFVISIPYIMAALAIDNFFGHKISALWLPALATFVLGVYLLKSVKNTAGKLLGSCIMLTASTPFLLMSAANIAVKDYYLEREKAIEKAQSRCLPYGSSYSPSTLVLRIERAAPGTPQAFNKDFVREAIKSGSYEEYVYELGDPEGNLYYLAHDKLERKPIDNPLRNSPLTSVNNALVVSFSDNAPLLQALPKRDLGRRNSNTIQIEYLDSNGKRSTLFFEEPRYKLKTSPYLGDGPYWIHVNEVIDGPKKEYNSYSSFADALRTLSRCPSRSGKGDRLRRNDL